jgi:hypothetical protein
MGIMALQSVNSMYRTVQPENYKMKAPEMTRMDSIPDPHQNGKPDPHQKTVWIRNTGAEDGYGYGSVPVCSVADPGCFSRIPNTYFSIPDLNFSITDPGSRVERIPDPGPGSSSKNSSIFNPKNCF